MSSIEIEQQIADEEKKLKEELLPQLQTVEIDRMDKQRKKLDHEHQISELRVELKDLDIGVSKARHLVRQQELLIKKLTRDFWAEKKAGQ